MALNTPVFVYAQEVELVEMGDVCNQRLYLQPNTFDAIYTSVVRSV